MPGRNLKSGQMIVSCTNSLPVALLNNQAIIEMFETDAKYLI